jgi:hypothetical protein
MDATKKPYSRVLPQGGVTSLCLFQSSLMAMSHNIRSDLGSGGMDGSNGD